VEWMQVDVCVFFLLGRRERFDVKKELGIIISKTNGINMLEK
jgi:hypothetical protein